MFVRCKKRFKDGKEHRYWSVVENVRVSGGRVVQRQVLYLGEINDSQRADRTEVANGLGILPVIPNKLFDRFLDLRLDFVFFHHFASPL